MFERRSLLKGAAGLSLAAILADPLLARAAAGALDDVSLTLPDGRTVTGALALPETTPASAVMLVHEWWGLNDQIKSVAADLAREGYVALAIDLYGGQVATTPDAAKTYMTGVKPDEATATVAGWLRWLKAHEKAGGKVATVGWCFGGGWALNAALAEPVDATVVYYGNVAKSAEALAPLQGPVLGHFATRDGWINKEMVDGFESAMTKAGKSFETHWYEADHAFANPSGGRYDQADAELSWKRTLDFYRSHL
ncbi:dienelactone hydrolase family protein [Oceanibacterium hippocampi]|uniref:Carboxymethylenebutenolidase n=1 Tax=Oceanibacterium hippocampi TaxID=745714 RepID=A0A1Y5S4P0_9PROT|nr:dienelactone hydrolase family protein [Oceanibacterium hippocampi]SLN32520.1 Carboxymethylenebutenolidase [Oceanibacterium hippocampi]